MAVDFGAKTAGVALSDPGKIIASPYETIVRDREGKIRATYRRLIDIAASEDVERIIVAQRGTHFCPNCQPLKPDPA